MSLTKIQKTAASHTQGHALILSGPGTGKTTTLIERAKLLINNGVPLESIFITTFTQKSAQEIKSRLYKSLTNKFPGEHGEKVINSAYIGTFHSLCARILKQYPNDVGLSHNFSIISDDEQKKLLNSLGFEWDEDEGNYIELISKWKDKLIWPKQAKLEAEQLGSKFLLKAAKAYSQYEYNKKQEQLIDFSDLITLTERVLRQNKEGSDWFHSRFSHILVDEFQDVNKAQVEFLKSAVGEYGTIWAVADEDQSLYEWRGSDPVFCLNFQNYFPKSKIYKLEDNFRCPPLIVSMANALITNNKQRYDKTLRAAKRVKKSDNVIIHGFENEFEEADFIADALMKLKSKNMDLTNCAILVRTSNVLTPIQRSLEKRRINFRLVGAHSFWDLKEVELFLKTTAKIADDKRFDNHQSFGKIHAAKHALNLAEEMKGEPLKAFAVPLSRILFEHVPAAMDAERRGAWISSVESILNIALEFNSSEEFLDYCFENKKNKNSSDNPITLTTLHSSKGLEWDMVIMMNCEEGSIPHFKSTNLEEERRLFYVGMTRSKNKLLLTYSRERNKKSQKPSRFLYESKTGFNPKMGKLIWKDKKFNTNNKNEIDKNEEKVVNKTTTNTVIKVGKPLYKHKGGKSLIPPDEREF